jgi:BirA family biotin operon repressor/biotin-[acetyl-CoA-carboxylase] ligase
MLIALLNTLDQELAALNDAGSRAELNARLMNHSTWLLDRKVHVHGPLACSGVTAGLDANGMLLVKTGEGLRTITTGGIRNAS